MKCQKTEIYIRYNFAKLNVTYPNCLFYMNSKIHHFNSSRKGLKLSDLRGYKHLSVYIFAKISSCSLWIICYMYFISDLNLWSCDG